MELSVVQWVVVLFVFTFVIGILAPIGGVGGGVLFVPLAAAFFPFSIDFVRGAGLIMALTSSLSSTPYLIRKGLSNLKIMIPAVVVSNITAIIGSIAGLWVTNTFPTGESYIIIALGGILLVIFVFMLASRQIEFPQIKKIDTLSQRLKLDGRWYEPSSKEIYEYATTNLPLGLLMFSLVGFVAGMFGLGAGWASVPVLNLVMGAPIKVAVATSMAIITVNTSSASWVYLAKGAILPLICIPSIMGMSIGARVGAKLAAAAKPLIIKYLVMFIMLLAAVLDIVKGIHGLHVL